MIQSAEFTLQPKRRGFHLITGEVMQALRAAGIKFPDGPALLNLFVKHTSCALSINENYDPDVRHDMEGIYNRLVPENAPYYLHTDEGPDDMPSHAKSSLTGVSLTIPVADGHLNTGTWQGIYLCEFRDNGGPRRIVATLLS